MSLGLLFSALGFVVLTQAMIINKPQEFKQYEVVYPQKLHVMQKRQIQENLTEPYGKEEEYESEVQYQITLNGENVIFQLHQNNDFLSPDYTETYYLSDGKKITTSPQMMKHCYYQGHILNEEDSVASLSLCGGLRGFFKHHNQRYLIEPLKDGDQQAHAVLKYEDLDPANQTCGIESSDQKHTLTRNTRTVSNPKNFLTSPKYINLLLVMDKAFYNKYNGNQTLIRNFLFEVINLLNVIYNTLDVHVALVGMEIWSDTNKVRVEPDIGTTYTAFLNWHRSRKGRKHNHAQLLSGIDFNNRRVGFTAQNSMCNPNSVAVIEASRKTSVSLVGVMSHELGHVLGMSDVSHFTKCPSGSCVMNQYLTSKFPKDFSAASRKEFHNYLSSRKPMCLLRPPAPEDIITNPVCGNKLQEVGEDCDCGKSKECTNSCCDAKTCKWKPGVPCERDTAKSARSNSSVAFSQTLSNGRSRSVPEYFLNLLLGPVSCVLLVRYGQV